jgi:NADH-quinone oxidoreductase E subunit
MAATDTQVRIEDLDDILRKFDGRPSDLIPVLQNVQEKFGYVPAPLIKPIAAALHVFPSQVQGVMTFYAQFTTTPRGRNTVRVCRGTACHVRGSRFILDAVVRMLGISPGETTEDGKFSLEKVACFGSCALAPVVVVAEKVHGRMTSKRLEKLIEGKSK